MAAYRIAAGLASKDTRRSELIFRRQQRGLTVAEAADLKRLDGELFAYVLQKYPRTLHLRRVADGIVVDGLKPGIHLATGIAWRELERMQLDGSLWPYELRFWDYFETHDAYVAGIEEG